MTCECRTIDASNRPTYVLPAGAVAPALPTAQPRASWRPARRVESSRDEGAARYAGPREVEEMDVEARLARLETSNRRLRNALRALSLLVIAVIAGGAAPQIADVVQTRSLQIVDASGRPIVVLG